MVILAAGLTPAWQQILAFREFRVGEVNRASQVVGCASGKVLNVGAAVHHLGATSLTLSPVGGLTGQQIRDDFAALGIPARWLESSVPTRVCTTLLDEATGITTELVENSAALPATEIEAYFQAFQESVAKAELIVMSGSLPRDTPSDFYARLMSTTSAPVLLDVRGRELDACLPHRPWLVKPNREELAMTYGDPLDSEAKLLAAMRELQSRGARHVVVSDGSGLLFAAGPDGIERFTPPRVETINPIGCGDCLAAGIAVATLEGKPWREAVAFGVAVAAQNASQLLPARFFRSDLDARLLESAADSQKVP